MKMLNVVGLEDLPTEECFSASSNQITIVEVVDSNFHSLKKTKWLQLLAFWLLCAITGLNVFCFQSGTKFISEHLGISETKIELATSVCFIFHAVLGVFFSYLMKLFGFKTSFMTAGLLYITGNALVAVGLSLDIEKRSLFLVVLGEILNAVGFTIVFELPPILIELRNGKGKNLVETSFFVTLLFGIVANHSITPLVASLGDVTSKVLQTIALCKAAASLLVLVVAGVVFCRKTDAAELYPNLLADVTEPTLTWMRFYNAIQLSFMDIHFLFITQAYAINFAILTSLCTFMHDAFAHVIPQNITVSSLMQCGFTAAALLGVLCGAAVAKRRHSAKIIGIASSLLSSAFVALLTYSLTSAASVNISTVFVVVLGVTSAAWLAVGMKHTRKISGLPAIDTPHTANLVTGSLYTVILVALGGWMKECFGFKAVGYFYSFLYLISSFLMLICRETKLEYF